MPDEVISGQQDRCPKYNSMLNDSSQTVLD